MTRKTDLEKHIREAYGIIRECEDLVRLAASPVERLRNQRTIEEQQRLIQGYLDEYLALCRMLAQPPGEDIAQIDLSIKAPRPAAPTAPSAKELPMRGIPSALLHAIQNALKDCDELYSPRQLRASFSAEELSLWRDGVPFADNIGEQVDILIDYMREKCRTDGRNGLVLLLQTLGRRKSPDDELHDRLLALADQLGWLRQLEPQPEAAVLEANPQKAPMLWMADAEKMLACARSVARIDVPHIVNGTSNNKSTGTAWLVAPGLALTCWHVIAARSSTEPLPGAPDLEAQIEQALLTFDLTVVGQGVQYRVASLEYPTLDAHPLDYALLRLVDRAAAPARERGYLRLDIDAPLTAQTVLYIIQHPLGQPQQGAGDTFVRPSQLPQRILYKTPTEPGTSGAPVLNRVNWRVVTLHNGESAEGLREGTRIGAILDDLRQHRPVLYDEIMAAQNAKE